MDNNKSRLKVVSQVNFGVYIWKTRDGKALVDEDFNYLSINAFKGDLQAISKIHEAAKSFGYGDGEAYFIEGSRKISEDEYQEQVWRLENGYIPDPYDAGVYKDSL